MPEFIHLFKKQLSAEIIEETLKPKIDLSGKFRENWIGRDWIETSPDAALEVLGIDSSSQRFTTPHGGVFYVVRAIGISRNKKYRELISGFDFCPNTTEESYIMGRKREWLEHLMALRAMEDGFSGFILFDGSIYGREVHLPMETSFANDRAFMIEYFETLLKLLEMSRKERIPIVGISKESRSSFFREYLLMQLAIEMKEEIGFEEGELVEFLSNILDHRSEALKKINEVKNEKFRGILLELLSRKPDFSLILEHANSAGYTVPLVLGASARWRREVRQILKDPTEFVEKQFPVSSQDSDFINRAIDVIARIPEMPSVVSFHVLPSTIDTPLRVDVVSWFFGLDRKLADVGWPERVNADIEKILKVISAGYCGPENYNIWLKSAHDAVKLTRENFENLYLRMFFEISNSYKFGRRVFYG